MKIKIIKIFIHGFICNSICIVELQKVIITKNKIRSSNYFFAENVFYFIFMKYFAN